jgi:MYXO-CTERM domain-containing protein
MRLYLPAAALLALCASCIGAQSSADVDTEIQGYQSVLRVYEIDFTGSTAEHNITFTGSATGSSVTVSLLDLDGKFRNGPTPSAEDAGTNFSLTVRTPAAYSGPQTFVLSISITDAQPTATTRVQGTLRASDLPDSSIQLRDETIAPFAGGHMRTVADRAIWFQGLFHFGQTLKYRFAADFGPTPRRARMITELRGEALEERGLELFEVDPQGGLQPLLTLTGEGGTYAAEGLTQTSERAGLVTFEVHLRLQNAAVGPLLADWQILFNDKAVVQPLAYQQAQFSTSLDRDETGYYLVRVDHGDNPAAVGLRVQGARQAGVNNVTMGVFDLEVLSTTGSTGASAFSGEFVAEGSTPFEGAFQTGEHSGVRDYLVYFVLPQGGDPRTVVLDLVVSAYLPDGASLKYHGAHRTGEKGDLKLMFNRIAAISGPLTEGRHDFEFPADFGTGQRIQFAPFLWVTFAQFMAIDIVDGNGVAHSVVTSPYGTPIFEPQDSGFFAGRVTVRVTMVLAAGGGEADCLMFFPKSVPIGTSPKAPEGDNGGCTTGQGPSPTLLAALMLLAILSRRRKAQTSWNQTRAAPEVASRAALRLVPPVGLEPTTR